MRDRLMALINDVVHPCHAGALADYLISNGVIVPPCKVGDTVYYFYEGGEKVYEGVVTSFVYVSGTKSFILYCDGVYGRYGLYFFLTREEAERALRGGE